MGLKELEKWARIQPFQVEELKNYGLFMNSIHGESRKSKSKMEKYQKLFEKENSDPWS